MTGKDFARSVVAGADVKLIDPLLNKVDELEERLASYQVGSLANTARQGDCCYCCV